MTIMGKKVTEKNEEQVLKLILSRLNAYVREAPKRIDIQELSSFWVYKKGEVLLSDGTYSELVEFADREKRSCTNRCLTIEKTPKGIADFLAKSPMDMITERVLDDGAVEEYRKLREESDTSFRIKSTKYIVDILIKYNVISPSGEEKDVLSRLMYTSIGFNRRPDQMIDVIKTFIHIHNKLAKKEPVMKVKVIELERFADAAALLDQVGDNSSDDSTTIETITTLANDGEWSAIDTLFIQGGADTKAEYMVESVFDISMETLNGLADAHGFERV